MTSHPRSEKSDPSPSSTSSPESTSPTFSSSSSSSPSPAPMGEPTSSLLFRPPAASSGPSPLEEELSSPSLDAPPRPDPVDESASDLRSTLSGRAGRKLKRSLLPRARTTVTAVGNILHQVLTVDGSLEREHQLYVPDEDDVEAIAEPLAGLASRRLPEGAGDPDVADLISLAFGVAGYLVKQLQARSIIRSYKRQLAQGAVVDHTPESVDLGAVDLGNAVAEPAAS